MGVYVVLVLEGREYKAQLELGVRASEQPWSWIFVWYRPKARQVGSAVHRPSATSKQVEGGAGDGAGAAGEDAAADDTRRRRGAEKKRREYII